MLESGLGTNMAESILSAVSLGLLLFLGFSSLTHEVNGGRGLVTKSCPTLACPQTVARQVPQSDWSLKTHHSLNVL